MTDTRVCLTCQIEKPLTEYVKHSASRGGYRIHCNPCLQQRLRDRWLDNPELHERHKARLRAYNAANPRPRSPEEKRRHHLWTRYRLRPERYDEILSSQGGRCAICRTDSPGTKNGSFHVDHDHACCAGVKSCGKCIRGLLCSNCNTGLGLLKESESNLRSALAYLSGNRS